MELFILHDVFERQSKTELTGIESFVYTLQSKNDVSWFPINRAIALVDMKGEEDEFEPLKNIEKLESQMETMENKVKTLEEHVDSLLE